MPSDEHARHDLRHEDDPQAGAEISLAKKRGGLYNIPFVHLSFKTTFSSVTFTPGPPVTRTKDRTA